MKTKENTLDRSRQRMEEGARSEQTGFERSVQKVGKRCRDLCLLVLTNVCSKLLPLIRFCAKLNIGTAYLGEHLAMRFTETEASFRKCVAHRRRLQTIRMETLATCVVFVWSCCTDVPVSNGVTGRCPYECVARSCFGNLHPSAIPFTGVLTSGLPGLLIRLSRLICTRRKRAQDSGT